MIKIKLNNLPSKYGAIKQILVEQGSHVKAFQNILLVNCEGQEIPVSTLFDGDIEKLFVAEGDSVKRGDVVVKMKIMLKETVSEKSVKPIKSSSKKLPSNWEEQEQELKFNLSENQSHLEKGFTAEFEKKVINQKLSPTPKPKSPHQVIEKNKSIINSNSVISDMQEKNESGISKFRQRILNKLNDIQEKTPLSENNLSSKTTSEELIKKNEKPLSFREIIMKRMNNLQEQVVTVKESKTQSSDANASFVDNARNTIYKKIDLIQKGKINNDSNIEEINKIISEEVDDKLETKETIKSQYQSLGYQEKNTEQDKAAVSQSEVNLKELIYELTDENINTQQSNQGINNMLKNSGHQYVPSYFHQPVFIPPKYVPIINPQLIASYHTDMQQSFNSLSQEQLEKIAKQNLIIPLENNLKNENLINDNGVNIEINHSAEQKSGHLETRKMLSKARNSAVEALILSNKYVPHLTLNCEVDMNNVIALCERMSSHSNNSKTRLNSMVFIIKAISLSLEEYPKLNASYDADTNELVIKRYHNIAIARQYADGLQTPVIRLVDKLSIAQLATDIEQSDQRIRARKTNDLEFVGSTITITNFGMVGANSGISPIFYPNVAVMGIGKILRKPVVYGQSVTIRHMMNITLTVDQRAIDIYDAGQFLETLKNNLEKPYILSLS
ncbi:2-oxo acid dehydrogenase subunit E2 [Spiroplasma endosymbiont of 'Nebria riversi']|uniref:2-oxo acid dehydrogenase subunit E2 n=1 Tax=Spiroplasma endosymbiont of 'Nebria riversi' TaxID=2792084 RepID=UPI001C0510F3|nr:2-oxo acid dehydrogenase subunit E2 [Spiroplasma endosymbiont of 'Nebria riversi']